MAQSLGALRLTLYDPKTSEVRAEYVRSFIPWGYMKLALRLQKKIAAKVELDEETVDELAALVVGVFGNQFTLKDLSDGADVREVQAAAVAIIVRAAGLLPRARGAGAANPPTPAG